RNRLWKRASRPTCHSRRRKRKERNPRLNFAPAGRTECVVTFHAALRSGKGTTRYIIMAATGGDNGLFANHAFPLDHVDIAIAVSDPPVAGHKLHDVVRIVLNANVIDPE